MINQQENSPLFRLEDAIRFRIFECYLTFTEDDFSASPHPIDRYIDPAKPYSTTLPPLMRTCKRAYQEISPATNVTAALHALERDLYGDRCYGFAVHGVLRLERLTYLSVIVDMPYSSCPMWLYNMQTLLPRMTSLVHVTLDWAPYSHVHGYDTVQAKLEPLVVPLFRIFAGLSNLRTIYLFGQVPFHWNQLIADETRATVRTFPFGWWKRHKWEDPNIRYQCNCDACFVGLRLIDAEGEDEVGEGSGAFSAGNQFNY
ncbi:hypothetical protein F5X97DRAFT_323635 [Nemania serpens]|nr:hypothetical protein F5X97DRAFT_323635 [Nemania serpens]